MRGYAAAALLVAGLAAYAPALLLGLWWGVTTATALVLAAAR